MQNTSLSPNDDELCFIARAPTVPAMIAAIRIAQARAPGLTLTQFLVFLTVADEEGLRMNDLGARIQESQATVSRSVGILAAGHRGSAKPGYGLLELLRDPEDGRGRRAALSDAGRRLASWIETALADGRSPT